MNINIEFTYKSKIFNSNFSFRFLLFLCSDLFIHKKWLFSMNETLIIPFLGALQLHLHEQTRWQQCTEWNDPMATPASCMLLVPVLSNRILECEVLTATILMDPFSETETLTLRLYITCALLYTEKCIVMLVLFKGRDVDPRIPQLQRVLLPWRHGGGLRRVISQLCKRGWLHRIGSILFIWTNMGWP